MDQIFHRGELVDALRWAVATTKRGTESLPNFLRAVLQYQAWSGTRHDPNLGEQLPGSTTLEAFICNPPLVGLGTTVSFLEKFCDEETREMLHNAMQGQVNDHEPIGIDTQLQTLMALFSELPTVERNRFLVWAQMESIRGVSPSPSAAPAKTKTSPPKKPPSSKTISVDIEMPINGSTETKSVSISSTSSITPESAQAIALDYLDGLTCREAGAKHGAPTNTVYRLVRDLGINRPRAGKKNQESAEPGNEELF